MDVSSSRLPDGGKNVVALHVAQQSVSAVQRLTPDETRRSLVISRQNHDDLPGAGNELVGSLVGRSEPMHEGYNDVIGIISAAPDIAFGKFDNLPRFDPMLALVSGDDAMRVRKGQRKIGVHGKWKGLAVCSRRAPEDRTKTGPPARR